MKNLSILMLALLATTFFAGSVLAVEPKKVDDKEVHEVETEKGVTLVHTVEPPTSPVSGSASVGVYNRYIFRGYELSTNSFVVQPAISVSYKGFTGSLWGNIDSDEHVTQTLSAPDREGHKSFNEIDLTLSYTHVFGKLGLTGGYIYYGTKYTAETEELFISATYDTLLKPTLAVYRDITSYPGTYMNLSVSHSLPVFKEITLDMGASAGYFIGNDDYWKTYEKNTDDYTGKKYRGFHDGMVKAGFTIPVAKNIVVQPLFQYWFPLSGKAGREINGNSYNFNGKLDDTFVYGVGITMSF